MYKKYSKAISFMLVFALIMTNLFSFGMMNITYAASELKIQHTQIADSNAYGLIPIEFKLMNGDNSTVAESVYSSVYASVYYKHSDDDFEFIDAINNDDGTFSAVIPANKATENIEYYIAGIHEGNTIRNPKTEDTTYTINIKKYADKEKLLTHIGNFTATDGQGGRGVAEIVKYDKVTKKAFVVNGVDTNISIDIVDLTGLQKDSTSVLELTTSESIKISDIPDLGSFTVADITCIDIHPSGEYFAVSLPNADKTKKGKVAFFNIDKEYKGNVDVGFLPDNLAFTPDGNNLLVANEGEPNDDYVDPAGSVSVIDLSSGVESITQGLVTDVGFNGVSVDENVIIKDGATNSEDFEPEYIVVDENSQYAYIALQENNAIAKLDIANKEFVDVTGLGFKDWSVSALDGSNKDDKINIKKWPVLGMYMPDGIDIATINGTDYIFTANEGDGREWGDYENEVEVGDIADEGNLSLDADNYEGYTQEQLEAIAGELGNKANIGKLNVHLELGKNDEGKYEALYTFGGRSFSIYNASDLSQVYDSGSEFEEITAQRYPDEFNTTNDEVDFDDRSDNKGPEPEDVKVGKVGDKYYAFVGLERMGGVMVYDVTNPEDVEFVQYMNTRDYSDDIAGDCGPEGLKFVARGDSPIDQPLLLVANEVSGTLSIFQVKDESKAPLKSEVRIAVISDPHLYLSSLGTGGAAFDEYLANDRKLIAESQAIVEEAVSQIKDSDVEIVLVSGDLTKDGAKVSHEKLAALLAEIEATGKKVYVIDGNHDINNTHAVGYKGNEAVKVDYVTPESYKTIYNDFGYSEAIAKDPNSLSYVVEPVDGLWVIGIDSALYDTNIEDDYPKTGGAFSQARLNWIKAKVSQGRAQGKRVIGFMHHGLVEHFEYQEELFSQYVIKDWEIVSTQLADLGMEAVFTGHFHSNDIVKKTTDSGNTIYDIETGSLLTYPCPYRIVELTEDNKLNITTNLIESIKYDTGDLTFQEHAREFLIAGLEQLAEDELVKLLAVNMAGQGASKEEIAAIIASHGDVIKAQINATITGTPYSTIDLVVAGLEAHYAGDETIDPTMDYILKGMLASDDTNNQFLGAALLSLWNDPAPKDNDVTIQLSEVPEPQRNDDDDDDDDNSSSNNNSSSSGSGGKPSSDTTDNGETKKVRDAVEDSISNSMKKTVSIKIADGETPQVFLEEDTIDDIIDSGKPLEISSKNISLTFDGTTLQQQKLESDQAVKVSVGELDEEAALDILEDATNSSSLISIGNKIYDFSYSIVEDGEEKDEVTSFSEPVKVVVSIDNDDLTEEQIANLTAVRLVKNSDGTITTVKLGGTYDPDTNTFTFHTDRFSMYSVMVADKLTKIFIYIDDSYYTINNTSLKMDTPPTIVDDRTLVPVRAIAEALDATVSWNDKTRKVTITTDSNEVTIQIGVSNKKIGLDVAPIIQNSRTLVPLRFVSENLGANVKWYPSERKIELVK